MDIVGKCMVIRDKASSEWRLPEGSIEGFTFYAGTTYKLRVKITQLDNPPADGSSEHWKLIRIIPIKKTIFVRPELEECTTGMDIVTQCMVIREKGSSEWRLFEGNIVGFDYEPGFSYKLRIKIVPVQNPPADGSTESWELIRTIWQR